MKIFADLNDIIITFWNDDVCNTDAQNIAEFIRVNKAIHSVSAYVWGFDHVFGEDLVEPHIRSIDFLKALEMYIGKINERISNVTSGIWDQYQKEAN